MEEEGSKSMREQRACFFCSMIKKASEFNNYGCENCPFLPMKKDRANVYECTSASFDGFVIF